MKEKITIMLTLVSLIGLAFHYNYKTNVLDSPDIKVINKMDESANSSGNQNEDIINIDYTSTKDDDIAISSSNKCNKNKEETDGMTFGDAFNYYYSCNINKDTFMWNNNEFALSLDSKANNTNNDGQSNEQTLVAR